MLWGGVGVMERSEGAMGRCECALAACNFMVCSHLIHG